MHTAPRSQAGIAALRERLFFAGELLRLAERELAGDAGNPRARAMACRQGAVLQLYAVYTGLLEDTCVRLRCEVPHEVPTLANVRAALAARGLESPELVRVEQLAGHGWLADCLGECRRVLSAQPAGAVARPAGDHDHDDDHGHAHEGGARRIGMAPAVVSAPLDAGDLARLRDWIARWKSLLDEFVVTLDEF